MLAVALAALAAIPALAAAAAPEWGLAIAHEPREVGREPATPQVWTVEVEGNAGKLHLEVGLNGKVASTKALPLRATATEVKKALEAISFIGANVEVTGGPSTPGQAEWTYTIKFVGALEGVNLSSLEAEAETTEAELEKVEKEGKEALEGFAEATEEPGERNTVEYAVTATNLGGVPDQRNGHDHRQTACRADHRGNAHSRRLRVHSGL